MQFDKVDCLHYLYTHTEKIHMVRNLEKRLSGHLNTRKSKCISMAGMSWQTLLTSVSSALLHRRYGLILRDAAL